MLENEPWFSGRCVKIPVANGGRDTIICGEIGPPQAKPGILKTTHGQ